MSRAEEISRGLAEVRRRIADAAAAAGRSADELTLVVVTKRFPVDDIVALSQLGVTDIGENRDQEACVKVADIPGEVREQLTVHFVGQLQTNKAASVASYADTVHSVDRGRLVTALDRAAERRDRPLDVLVQVCLDPQPGRGGAMPDEVPAVADAVVGASHLRLRGLMAVAPLGEDPAAAFARLVTVGERLRAEHPDAGWLSAGMSGDIEAAVAAGATHLRVGTAILGSRPPLG